MANEVYNRSKKIIRQILSSQEMTKDDLLCILYNFDVCGKNMVPLEIHRGKLQSKILDDIIAKDNCIAKYGDELLTLKQRCKSKISNSIELPYEKEFKFKDIYKGLTFTFCGDSVKMKPLYSPEMAKIAPLIPNTPDLGAFFTMPVNSKIFELFLPLYQEDDESIIFEMNSNISKPTAHNNFKNTYALVNKYLKDYISDCNVENTLYSFLNVIYPLSICTYNEYCFTETEEQHISAPFKSEDYLSNSKRMKNSRCHCGRTLSFRVTKLKSKKIKNDLINGVFSEWYASKKIESVGFTNTFWNTNIIFDNSNEKHVDAIGFDKNLIILMECKRIYNENNDYREAITKLKNDKKFFQEKYPEMDVVIGLMTNIREGNIVPEEIDFHINHENFLDFEDILQDYV